MIWAILQLIGGFILLMLAADRFVAGACATARRLGVSPLLIGLTIVGIGTSAPELFVSGAAAWNHHAGIAIGNAIGSNIANISLVLGLTALFQPLTLSASTLWREFTVMLLALFISSLLLYNGWLGRGDAWVLLAVFVIIFGWLIRSHYVKQSPAAQKTVPPDLPPLLAWRWTIFWLVFGLLLLPVSADILVRGATTIARSFGVSDVVIGLTLIAIGTSLPEIATSLVAAFKREADIAVGNVIGSNLFNSLAVLMLPGFISPDHVAQSLLWRDIPMMMGISLLCFGMIACSGSIKRLTRWHGIILLSLYGLYLTALLIYPF